MLHLNYLLSMFPLIGILKTLEDVTVIDALIFQSSPSFHECTTISL